MVKQLLVAVTAALVITGCKNGINTVTGNDTSCAVIVGMENSAFAGACPGAGLDADNMTLFLGSKVGKTVTLKNNKATKSAVRKALVDAVNSYDYVVFFYSGHGGSERVSSSSDEDDGMDEYLCFYDQPMLDDEVWSIISKAKGKVFLIFDCCHSQTMYRNPGITFRKVTKKARKFGATSKGAFRMLCWSGCPDDTYSYGGPGGGVFTNTLLNKFSKKDSYASWWLKVSTDQNLLSNEEPQQTVINWNITDKAFK